MRHLYQSTILQLLLPLLLHISAVVGKPPKPSATKVHWSPCPSAIPPGVDCGTIDVPLAYETGNTTKAKGDKTVKLFLTRLNSTGKGAEGTLFYNPGGPGVPAAYIVAAGSFYPSVGFNPEVYKAYDVIGLDPRGVGYSSPIKCNPKIFNERVKTFVNDTRGYNALLDHNRRLGESCANLTGNLLDHLDSLHVAKDFDLVRQALGAKKFNYFGLSYGSLIGSQYLSLFPKHAGRMALDGLIDHSQSEISSALTESVAYETALDQFFGWCDRNTSCALHGKNIRGAFDELLSRADKTPIPALGCNGTCQPNVTGEDIRYNVQNYLEFVDAPLMPNWIDLGGAIAQALEGNATILSTALATDETSVSLMGSPYSYLAIGCQDWLHRSRSAIDYNQRRQAIKPFAPRTAGASQGFYYQSNCIKWPAPVSNGQAPLNDRVKYAPPVLLTNSVYDPACSIAWADGLRAQLPTAVSITRNGFGHTSHFLLGETRNAIDNYLATGRLPKDGSVFNT